MKTAMVHVAGACFEQQAAAQLFRSQSQLEGIMITDYGSRMADDARDVLDGFVLSDDLTLEAADAADGAIVFSEPLLDRIRTCD